MDESNPVLNLTILLVTALIGGMIAHRLKQPIILGYLVVGITVGPDALGLVGNRELVESMATIGVALLMLTLGLEFSFAQLRQVGRIGLWGGLAQIMATSVIGFTLGLFVLKWPLSEALLFGLVIYNSSTAVCLKLLIDRAELDSAHGRIMIAVLILQDVTVVVMMVVMPLLGEPPSAMAVAVGTALIKAVAFTGAAVVLGLWIMPWLLGRVGGIRSRELFLLTVLALCLGAAIGTYYFGLPVVLGSFVIGLTLRESRYAQEALAEVTPLRDIFAALFFVSLGMLLSPAYLIQHWQLVLITVLMVSIVKSAVIYAIVRLFGYSGRVAMITGTGLIQVGEFGFILAQAGVTSGIVNQDFRSLMLACSIISMLLTPLTISLAVRFSPKYTLGPTGLKLRQPGKEEYPYSETKSNPIILAGYGRVGRHVTQALHQNGMAFTVIEIDPQLVMELRKLEVTTIYGDASNEHILRQAGAGNASILVVTYPDPLAVIQTAKNALRLNPAIKILARLNRPADSGTLKKLGNVELVSPEYEASMAFLTHTLAASGWQGEDIRKLVNQMRQSSTD
jgi:CPA2 family monovalent cation:H+ antiporter-2